MKHYLFVSLFLLTLILSGCKKQKQAGIYGIGGKRNWHGWKEGNTSFSGNTPYYYTIYDTFAIQVISEKRVEIVYCASLGLSNCFFQLDTINVATQTMILRYAGGEISTPPGYSEPDTLTYYYGADSITMTGAGNGLHGSEIIFLKTP